MVTPTASELAFLVELTALTRKYGIAVAGCGCCGSPRLDHLTGEELSPEAAYCTGGIGDIGWTYPGEHYWDIDKDRRVILPPPTPPG